MLTNAIAAAIVASAMQAYPESPVTSFDDLMCLTEAIYHESRGEPLKGMYSVALVIENRRKSNKFPDTYCGVVKQPKQFSYRNSGQPLVKVDSFKTKDADKLWWSVTVALDVSNGHISDWLGGSTHYVNFSKIKNQPKWLQSMEVTSIVGEHSFLKRGE